MLTPPKQNIEMGSVRLDFSLSNNQAEYEAMIIGLLWV